MSADYMCPFCATPWKCNGPHIDEQDLPEFEAYMDGIRAAALLESQEAVTDWFAQNRGEAVWPDMTAAIDALLTTHNPNMSSGNEK